MRTSVTLTGIAAFALLGLMDLAVGDWKHGAAALALSFANALLLL